jgi:hypothetical protein
MLWQPLISSWSSLGPENTRVRLIFQLGGWTLSSFAKQLSKAESCQNNVLRRPDLRFEKQVRISSRAKLGCQIKLKLSFDVENIPISSGS